MSTLTVISSAVAYNDDAASSNPTQLPINWRRTNVGVPVDVPETTPFRVVPLGTATLINGSRTTTIDGTTAFSVATSALESTRYRITATGGTAPGFRTNRNLACNNIALTLTVNSNLSMSVAAGTGTPFSAVQVGDVVFIPGTSTGDPASPFNPLNEGYWTVLSSGSALMTLARDPSVVFAGASQVVTPSGNSFIQAFSSDGVQVGDTVEIASGFAAPALHSYGVVAVNPLWVEFESTSPLGSQTGITPGASGLLFYTASKRWLRIEADQECVLRLNGDSGNSVRLEPIIAGDRANVGWFEIFGSVWQLVVVNRSTGVLNVTMLAAE